MEMFYPDMAIFQLGSWLLTILLGLIALGLALGVMTMPMFFAILYSTGWVLRFASDNGISFLKYIVLMFRSLQRNLLRTALSYLAIFVLVFMITAILSVLMFIDKLTEAKEGNLKAIITEKFQNPSGMPRKMTGDIWAVATSLEEKYQPKSYRIGKLIKENNITRPEELMSLLPPDLRPKTLDEAKELLDTQPEDDIMSWSFVAGTLDPEKNRFEDLIFAFCLEPRKLKTMMPGLEELTDDQRILLDKGIKAMEANPQGIIVGPERLKMLRKQIGDKITITSKNYKGITFECEIIGVLPEGRWDQATAMHVSYLYKKLDEYKRLEKKDHEYAPKVVSLIWLRLPNQEAFAEMARIVNKPKTFNIAVKMETESSAYGSFLDAYRDMLWGMRWLMVPAIIATMTLVIANAISISVRERRTEMAVLKVLGFKPYHIMAMVLGEAFIIGLLAGGISASLAYFAVKMAGGIPFAIAFFPKFFIAFSAAAWAFGFGIFASFAGSIFPAWSARSVKAAEVFSKVA